jgi:hypothetical protein
MKKFDYPKAVRLINKLKPISADLGFREDWFWTAFTVYEKGSFIDIKEYQLNGSRWATPVLLMHFEDKKVCLFECHDNGLSETGVYQFAKGCLSGPTDSFIEQLEYEKITDA